MGVIKTNRTLFFTTSPRSPAKLIPEIKLLIDHFDGKPWTSGSTGTQIEYARLLAESKTFEGETSQKYDALSARDRINRAPQGLGFVNLKPCVCLTEAGHEFVYGKRPHEVFFRQLLKFQIPSPYHVESSKIKGTFWVRPYLEIFRLVRDLEYITPDEFRIFAMQLTDYRKYEQIKNAILLFRQQKAQNHGNYKLFVDGFAKEEIEKIYAAEIQAGDISTRESVTSSVNSYINKKKRNIRDYADAAFRYLRYTEMFQTDGKSLRIAPDKLDEIDYILSSESREPVFIHDAKKYKDYLFSADQPALYSDNRQNLVYYLMRFHSFTQRELDGKSVRELKDIRDASVQKKRASIIYQQEQELKSKSFPLYQEVIDTFNEIISDDIYDRPLFLEWNTWRAMTMLDGGNIRGNFKMDDSGRPVSTAQGNMPDIECDYGNFALSVEVTLQRGQKQYESEGESVTRHYAQLKQRAGKDTYCLFIAQRISKATLAHFFGLNQIRNISAYGGKAQIVPLELDSFMKLVENAYAYPGNPKASDIYAFLHSSIAAVEQSEDENDWNRRIQAYAQNWLWDPDFTKATPVEDAEMEQAIRELDAGEYVLDGDINWD